MSGIMILKQNLQTILDNPTPILKVMAEAVRDDICEVSIDGQTSITGGMMKRNAPSTIRRKGHSHSLWDTMTMRNKNEWTIRINGKTVILEPGAVIAARAVHVQELGYDFFGISKTGEKAADEAGSEVLRDMLEKGL